MHSLSQYILANKKVWEHGRDYYRYSNAYQKWYHFGEYGIASCKLTDISLAINMKNLDKWTSQALK